MTQLPITLPGGPDDRSDTVRAQGLLAAFAPVLHRSDIQVAAALLRAVVPDSARWSRDDEIVALTAALCVRALRRGSVTVDPITAPVREAVTDEGEAVVGLPWPDVDSWLRVLRSHRLVALEDTTQRPLVFADERVYLQKYRELETAVRDAVQARRRDASGVPCDPAVLAGLFPEAGPDRQRLATAAALAQRFTIIAGGPGTGKTTTIARLLVALRRATPGGRLIVGLAAPTGKAAARMQEATNAALGTFAGDSRDGAGSALQHEPVVATTLHRLLGWTPDPLRPFRHDHRTPLPHDVVIVDEMSMVDLPMLAALLAAVRPDARVILVGDPDQLASIDVGAVLADLVAVPGSASAQAAIAVLAPDDDARAVTGCGTVTLTTNHRFDRGIGAVAAAIRAGDADAVVTLLQDPDVPHARFATPEDIRAEVTDWLARVRDAAATGDASAALAAVDRCRILCAHRQGPYGVAAWHDRVRTWLGPAPGGPWAVGQGVVITANDGGLGIVNGDTGVVVTGPDGGAQVAFARPGGPLLIPPVRLSDTLPLDAMTVHRAQGSQFDAVCVVLPTPDSPLLTRELLYTAVTRARRRVAVIGTPDAVAAAVARRVERASRLTARLTADDPARFLP